MMSTLIKLLSPWDFALLAIVTVMGTTLAYVRDPKWKAFLLGLPFPFTVANLSLGEQVVARLFYLRRQGLRFAVAWRLGRHYFQDS
jgi:hypothetical protein